MKRFRRFGRDDHGSATIELLVWTPVLIELLLITVDVSSLYWRNAAMWTVARDTTRQVVRGAFDDETGKTEAGAVEAYALSRLPDAREARYAFDADEARHVLEIEAAAARISLLGTVTGDFDRIRVRYAMASER
jgi:Flp pilus assembly protein TadG